MYKHKPGIQMDEKGFNESKDITGRKIENVQHIAYEVIEPMLWEQEKKELEDSYQESVRQARERTTTK